MKSISASSNGRGEWFTSSYTNGTGSCVEVKFSYSATLVRDSKDGRDDRPIISVGAEGWRSFLDTVVHPTL
jgi:hypothetical protein